MTLDKLLGPLSLSLPPRLYLGSPEKRLRLCEENAHSNAQHMAVVSEGNGRWREPSRRLCGCCSRKSSSFWEISSMKGSGAPPQAWADDVKRFQKMFRHPGHVQLKVVVGNHDIGFHYQMNRYRIKRFEKVFNPERLFSWKGINFVMVNSVALEGDGCNICSEAEAELMDISHKLNCSREEQHPGQCGEGPPLPASAPVLLQHFPLYRRSDANCSGEDAAPPEEKGIPFKERYDVLSREASQKLLWWLRPRLILSGHTHSGCEVLHGAGVPELSVPSFSWRNRNNPSFIMGSLTPTEYALAKCYLPLEDTVLTTYCAAAGFLVVLMLVHLGLVASPVLFGYKLLRKFKTV
ncbi:metallophosphoesterase 1 isoform X3 [Myotis lucifugus]|uniref:metallophosphoesterase 1 isoform X3 n=1 Tax=Myotis lucifugus TaxID=59463 RepID=UPI000CCC0889|nr:metallophosphoesterase 1 isoform X3 [Myotis lucifugus]